jgi:hypothetical protein
MDKPWEDGMSVLYQEIWANELLTARPVTVAADNAGIVALYSHPKTRFRSSAIGSARYGMPLDQRIAAMVAQRERSYAERTASDSHVLVVTADHHWSALWLFWTDDWKHQCWYVNLQQPIRRTERGIQIRDCALDLVVAPDRSWRWKDRDEFEALCRCKFFPDAVAERAMDEARRMIDAIERWDSPFADGWEQWRPDPAWSVPELPDDWNVLA